MIPRFCAKTLEQMHRRFSDLYGPVLADRCRERLASAIGRYGVGINEAEPPVAFSASDIVLVTYADMLRKPGARSLNVLRKFLNARLRGAVNTVHLLPFFPWSSDDGFSVIDYRSVNPDYGEWDDVKALGRNFKLMFDLVLNHVSRESKWFEDYIRGRAPVRDYFIEVDPSADLSAVVRPRTGPLTVLVNTREGERHVWTTFSEDQIDLNFSNPDVLFDFLDILLLYLSKGACILRLDAVAYLWKEIGTDCIHRPQAHAIVKILRDLLNMVAPAARLLTETNVPHEENVSYFGDGDEAHMVYQFVLPPLLLHALHRQDARFLTRWAAGLKPPPPGCSYLNFTASHDGIGVRPLQGVIPEKELHFLAKRIEERGGSVSHKRNADGSESPYEFNITYLDAVSDPGGRDREGDRRRFLASQAVMLAMQGVPAVYFHSLFGSRNDREGVARTGMARSINRRKFAVDELNAQLEDAGSEPHAVFEEYRRMLFVRIAQPAFSPQAEQEVLEAHSACFALRRHSAVSRQTLICISNLSADKLLLDAGRSLACLEEYPFWRDLLSETTWSFAGGGLELDPWQTRWLCGEHSRE